MDTVIIILLSLSALLFIVSFFQKDKTSQLETEVEELSMTLLQENHNLKKRIMILEEELLLEKPVNLPSVQQKPGESIPVHGVLKNQVLSLHSQGVGLQQISKQSALPLETVKRIIESEKATAGRNE